MAFACTSQLQYDNHSIADPLRELQAIEVLEQALLEQMEFSATHNSVAIPHICTEKNIVQLGSLFNTYQSSEHQSSHPASAHIQKGKRSNKSTQEYGQYMEFVDSPPDSKEAWSAEYLKPMKQGSKSTMEGGDSDVTGLTPPANIENALVKKRRMNWDNGAIVVVADGDDNNAEAGGGVVVQHANQQQLGKDPLQMDRRKNRFPGNHGSEIQNGGPASIVSVVPNGSLSDQQQQSGGGPSGNSGNSNSQGNAATGGAWTDDIDFDLNNDLSSNGYMNEALFYHSLGAFKQEVPSPQDKSLNFNQQKHQQQATNGNELMLKRSANIVVADGNRSPVEIPSSMTSPESGSNAGPNNIIHPMQNQQTHQQLCHIAQSNTANNVSNGVNVIANHINSDNVVSFQQLLQESNNFNDKLANGNGGVANGSGVVRDRVMTPPQLDKQANSTSYVKNDTRFQYVLAAATSIATKNNEDTLTYLNQGQSYEIKLKKLGDLTNFRNKILKSVIKICFYERRLQYMEREQMQQWQATRPGERILEIDVPLSYGCHPSQPANPNQLNAVEVMWDPMKEVGVYIRVNCISTEFTPKKHGGEKGVPFRIQVETYLDNKPVHGAMCQIKVFKLKGADRKHKQDREKIQKRSVSEQEKYQPSYECTILNDLPMDQLQQQQPGNVNPIALSPSDHIPAAIHSPSGNKFDSPGLFAYNHQNSNSDSSSNSLGVLNRQGSTSNPNLCKTLELVPSPPASLPTKDFFQMQNIAITKDTTPQQLALWINYHRLSSHQSTFAHFSGADLLRLNKDDLIQICGLADGIRLFNILHKKAITPRLTIFVSFDGAYYNAIYLYTNKLKELIEKIHALPGFRQHYAKKQTKSEGQTNGGVFLWELQQNNAKLLDESIVEEFDMLLHLPSSGIQVMMSEDVVSHIKDESLYLIVIENRRVILRPVVKE